EAARRWKIGNGGRRGKPQGWPGPPAGVRFGRAAGTPPARDLLPGVRVERRSEDRGQTCQRQAQCHRVSNSLGRRGPPGPNRSESDHLPQRQGRLPFGLGTAGGRRVVVFWPATALPPRL